MTNDPPRDNQDTERPRHTPEQERAFNERIRLLGQYHELAEDNIDPAVFQRVEQVGEQGDLEERQRVNYLWHHRWYLIPMLVVIAILVAVAVFYFGSGDDLSSSLSDTADVPVSDADSLDGEVANNDTVADVDTIEDWVANSLEATAPLASGDSSSNDSQSGSRATDPAAAQSAEDEPAELDASLEAPADTPADAPSHFVGEIITDNEWFRIVVKADGTVSGTLSVYMEVSGGTVTQSGTYNGSIDDDNVITCTGAYKGVSVDKENVKYPHQGSVFLTAYPTGQDLHVWQVDADGDPGDPVSLSARAY